MSANIAPQRRQFMVGFGRFALAAGLGTRWPAVAQAAADGPVTGAPASAWADLGRALHGQLLREGDAFFFDIARPNNLRFDPQPAGIARCNGVADVQACLGWLKKHDMAFAVRSGGHNYAGYSATRGLLIDMTPMAGAETVNAAEGTVKVQGGTLNFQLYKTLERLGRTITHGRCDRVGAAGFLLGGGIGFDMRRYGVGSDLLLETDIVLASGDLVKAQPNASSEAADLYWACRGGGGGNFGINTSFTLKTFPAGTVTVFNLTWTKDPVGVLYELLTKLPSAPNEFGCKISVSVPNAARRLRGEETQVAVLGQLHDSAIPLAQIFGSTWPSIAECDVKENVPYWVGQDFLGELTFPYFYQEKSRYLRGAHISQDAVSAMFDCARRMPGTSMPSVFKFFQVGGAIDDTAPQHSAYVHRGYDWLFSSEVNWAPKDSYARVAQNLDWQEGFLATIDKDAAGAGAYQNFPDPSQNNWQTAYYGDNYRRLQAVKTLADPHQLFRFSQSIRPT